MAEKKTDYRALQQELDEILAKMQHEELDIEAAVKSYERGMVIVKELEAHLGAAENTVTKLKAKFEA